MNQETKDNKAHDGPRRDECAPATLYPHSVPSALAQVDLAAQSHQGFVRERNEDHYLVVRGTRSLETLLTNMTEGGLSVNFGDTAYGILVADGIGGMASGEVASRVALLKLVDLVAQTPDWIMKLNERDLYSVVMRRMTNRFRQIDDELRAQGEANSSLHGMGTTLTAVVTLGTDVVLGHIGDSRAYLFRGQKLHQLTKDHTLAQAMVDAGLAKAQDTATKAMRHVLTAALGTTVESTDPQVQRLHLSDGDQLLLCTDGLTEMVADDGIAAVLTDATSSQAACQSLINLALAAGGNDNITVVLARYRFPQLAAN